MSGRLVLVRHGRTAWNGERFLGRVDVALDELGRRQARDLVPALAGVPVDAILCSPLLRACETAAPLAAARGVEPVLLEELAELDCGALQGELKAEHGKLSRRDPDATFPGGESLAAAQARATVAGRRALRDVAAGRTVVVVGHYVVNQLLLGALRGIGPAEALAQAEYRPRPGTAWVWDPAPAAAPEPLSGAVA